MSPLPLARVAVVLVAIWLSRLARATALPVAICSSLLDRARLALLVF
jgi:hypothetical protein